MSESKARYRTIMAPLDGSPRAELILPHVRGMAERNGSTVVLLRVVDPNQLIGDTTAAAAELTPEAIDTLVRDAQGYLERMAEQLSAAGIDVSTRVAVGPVVKTIVNVVEEEGVELVALASHGRTGLSRAFLAAWPPGCSTNVTGRCF